MVQKIIGLGVPDKGNGDPLRTAFSKVNENFTELYNSVSVVVTGATAPTSPGVGDLWWDTESGRMYVYYGTSWVDASPVDGAGISSTNQLVNGAHTVSLSSAGLTAFPAISNESLFIQASELGSANASIGISAKDSVIVTANILSTAKQWTFGTDGSLTLPAGTTYEYLSVPLTGHGDGLALLDFALVTDGVDAQWIAASPNPEGVGYSEGDTFTFDEEFLGIPGASVTIEVLTIGEGGSIQELGFTIPPLYPADIYRDSPINLQVGTESNRWTFGATGNLTLPPGGDIKDSTGASVLGLDNLVASGNTLTHNGNADSGVRLSNEIAQMYVDNTTLYGFSENDSSWTSVSWTSDGIGGGVVQFSGISESFATFNSQLGNHSRKYMSINNIGETEITGWGTGDPVSYYVTQAPEPSPAPNDIFAVGFRIVYENRLIMDEDEGDFGIYLKNQNFKIEMYDGSVESHWQFGSDGNLTLPNNAVIRIDGNNVEVGNLNNFNVEAAGVVNIYTATDAVTPFQWQFGDDGDLNLPDNGGIVFDRADTSIRVGMGFHIASGEGISLDAIDQTAILTLSGAGNGPVNQTYNKTNDTLYTGNDNSSVTVENLGGTWFVLIDGDAKYTSNDLLGWALSTGPGPVPVGVLSNGYKSWGFSPTGALTFPDNTVQTTAYLGITNTAGPSATIAVGSIMTRNDLSVRVTNNSNTLDLEIKYSSPDGQRLVSAYKSYPSVSNIYSGRTLKAANNTTWDLIGNLPLEGDSLGFTFTDHSMLKVYRVTVVADIMPGGGGGGALGEVFCTIEELK